MRASTSISLFWLTTLCVMSSTAWAAKVYYVNQPERTASVSGRGVVRASNLDGTNQVALFTAAVATDMRGIATDVEAKKLYLAYCELDSAGTATAVSLRQMPMSGGTPTVITSFADGPVGSSFNPTSDLEYDATNQTIYFAQSGASRLRAIKTDGTNLRDVLTHPGPDSGPYFIGLDLVNRFAYWGVVTGSGDTNKPYYRGTLAGMRDMSFSLFTPSRTRDIECDPTVPGVRLYWNDRQNGATYFRLATGSTTVGAARTGMNAPHGLALDIEAGKGYVADTGKRGNNPTQASAHGVVRFNLDGTGALEVLSPTDVTAEPWDLALDLTSTSYADWKTRFFAASETATSAATSDPDGDGYSNLAEYAFFTHPRKVDGSPKALMAKDSGIEFARRKVSTTTWQVEVSPDMTTWHYNGDGSGLVWTEELAVRVRDEESQWITIGPGPALNGATRLFYRIRAVGS